MDIFFPLLWIVLCLQYSALMFYFILGARKLHKKRPKAIPQKLPVFSVIVPAKNEEETIIHTLRALDQQNYAGDWEVICVNDASTDETLSILKAFSAERSRFKICSIPLDAEPTPSPKKRALATGFQHATGEILITTDADCVPPPNWLESMADNFSPSVGVVQGPKKVTGPNSIITRYQQLEVFGFVSVEAATFAMGNPMIASAPSLAYKKDLYEKVGGFQGLEHLVSGDDDMLVHKICKLPGIGVRYNLDATATVATPAVQKWTTLITQRARWASNGARYENKAFVALLVLTYLFYVWLLLGPLWAMFLPIPGFYILVPWILYCGGTLCFLLQTSHKFQQKKILWDFWWCGLLHIPIIVISVLMGQLGLYRWK